SAAVSGAKRGSLNADAHATRHTSCTRGQVASIEPQQPRSSLPIRSVTNAERCCCRAAGKAEAGKGANARKSSAASIERRANWRSWRPSASVSFIERVCAVPDDAIAIAGRVARVAARELIDRKIALACRLQQAVERDRSARLIAGERALAP